MPYKGIKRFKYSKILKIALYMNSGYFILASCGWLWMVVGCCGWLHSLV